MRQGWWNLKQSSPHYEKAGTSGCESYRCKCGDTAELRVDAFTGVMTLLRVGTENNDSMPGIEPVG
jgi:hypothetical protein